MNSLHLLLLVAILLGLNDAHRHHLNHHGRHHQDEHRHGGHHPEGPRHHRHQSQKGHDVEISVADLSTPKNETISIDVTRKLNGPNNEKGSIKVIVVVSSLLALVCS